jgi:ABC-type sugar transport system permease subunit
MFSFYPFIKTIVSSFSITSPFGEFISFYGLGNWKRLFEGGELLKAILTTLEFAAISLTVSFVVAMVFAIFCSDIGRGSKIYQTLFGLPMVIATAPVAAIWVFIYRQHAGLLNQLLNTNISWLKNPDTALVAVAIVTAWSHVASNYLYLLVGFRNVSDDLIEASKVDGAGWWVRTFKIMIPMASPQIFFVFFLNIVWSLKTITQIKLLTGGGPSRATTTLMYSIYDKAILRNQFEYACCEAVVLFLLIFIATRIQFAFEKRLVHYQ